MEKKDYKVLVVDDMAYVRLQVKKMLRKFGFEEINEAADGVAAITTCRGGRPDIIVLDIHLPKINGLDLIGFFLTINPECRILICSVEHDEAVFQKALSLGALDFIEKPVQEKIFFEKMNGLIEKKPAPAGKTMGTFLYGGRDFSEKIGMKLDSDKSVQILSLYGVFDQDTYNDLNETILSLKLYNYRNVLLNLNGITRFKEGQDKLSALKSRIEKENGKFLIILINKEMLDQLNSLGLGSCIVKTEIQALRRMK